MKQPWTLLTRIPPSPELVTFVGGHPLIAQLLAQRGFDTPAKAQSFLNPNYYAPSPPHVLVGVPEAARLLHGAIAAGQNLFVWGDFDVDGQTSTSLLVAALRKLAGDERVRFHVPNRFSEGHGIRVETLQEKLADPTFPIDLLLTCDTGIADAEGVTLAKQQGLTVIVTDHHDLTPEFADLDPMHDQLWGLPIDSGQWDSGTQRSHGEYTTRNLQPAVRYADAIVNPKFQPVDDPLRTLPGVGVAYKLIQQLYRLSGCAGDEVELLDLVALGIVADVAEQVNDALSIATGAGEAAQYETDWAAGADGGGAD
ncbi:MAG: DHH family phosphoesterase [Caldilineaceae bacterium]